MSVSASCRPEYEVVSLPVTVFAPVEEAFVADDGAAALVFVASAFVVASVVAAAA